MSNDQTKVCSICKQVKNKDQYYKDSSSKCGVRSSCKPCTKEYNRKIWKEVSSKKDTVKDMRLKYHYKTKYGLSIEEVQKLKAMQDYKCCICLKQKKLHVDHCHSTGKVRGLLCSTCNKSLGLLKDDINNLHRAIIYLEDLCQITITKIK